VAPAAQALGATLVAGSLVNLLPSVDGFRRNTPTLPPLTGLEGETTLAEKVADYINGARVQVGFPVPPPFLPPTVGLGLLATAYGLWDRLRDAAAQIWSLFNQPQKTPTNWEGPTGANIIPWGVVQGRRDGGGSVQPVVLHWNEGSTAIAPNVPDNARVFVYYEHLGNFSNGQPRGWVLRYQAHRPSGLITGHCVENENGFCVNDLQSVAEEPLLQILRWEYGSGDIEAPDVFPPVLVGEPVSAPAYLPATAPAPAVAPGAPLPLTQPQPQAPGEVAPPTTATPTAPPAVAPRTPAYPQPTPTQQPTPTGQPTAPDGSLVPLPLPLPTTTSPESHVINGTEVPANGPAPTLTGIAQELGRLERKSAQLLDPDRAPRAPNRDRLGNLEDLIKPLVEAILQQFENGTYELSSPCELNEAGERVPVVVPFGPGLSAIGTLHNKVDALAELLQASKDLKQPICRPKAPVGEPVTVNFEQVT
jgi:hypothetical protein